VASAGSNSVQIADKELPKSRRQQRLEKSAPTNDEYIAPLQENALKRKREQAELEQDPKLKEFLQVYQAPSKTNVWTNGDIQQDVAVTAAEEALPAVVVPEDESDDDYQVIAKKPKTATDPATLVYADSASKPPPPEQSTSLTNDVSTQHDEGMEGVEKIAEPSGGPVTDDDWLRSRTNRVLDLVEDDELPATAGQVPVREPPRQAQPESVEQTEETEQAELQQIEAHPSEVPNSDEVEKIRETGRLYLRNLHFDVTEEELRQHFVKYGSLEEVSYNLRSFIFPHNDEHTDRDN
jgi:multiple RNA-binding domain-containing protein 1